MIIYLQIVSDYSGVPFSVTFDSTHLKSCFNVVLHRDTKYEYPEGFNIKLNLNGTDIKPGKFPETRVVIHDGKYNSYTYHDYTELPLDKLDGGV